MEERWCGVGALAPREGRSLRQDQPNLREKEEYWQRESLDILTLDVFTSAHQQSKLKPGVSGMFPE